MADAKACPKCNGTMTQGKIMGAQQYAGHNQYMYVFAPDGEPGPDLLKIFSGKPLSPSRKALAAFCCDGCGFVEFYGISAG